MAIAKAAKVPNIIPEIKPLIVLLFPKMPLPTSLSNDFPPPSTTGIALKEKNFKDLVDIERRVGNIKVSMLDAKELYDLKGHVGEVRHRLNLVP